MRGADYYEAQAANELLPLQRIAPDEPGWLGTVALAQVYATLALAAATAAIQEDHRPL